MSARSAVPSSPTSDEEARARIGPWRAEGQPGLSDFAPETNFVVRAAAGAGKTTALVARMVALVRRGVPVRELAAITFTRKAAGEMNERLFGELRRAEDELRAHGAEEERRRVEHALGDLPSCFIGTIHAFCARILRNHSLAAGLPPRFSTGIDEREERELREKVLEAFLTSAYREQPGTLAELEDLGAEPDGLGPFFARLCRFPDLQPYTDGPEDAPNMDAAVEKGETLLEQWQGERPDVLEKGRDGAMKALDRAEKLLEHGQVKSPSGQAAFLECFADADGGVKVTYWGKKGTAPREAADTIKNETLPQFLEHTAGPTLRQWSAFVHRTVTTFLTPAVERYRAERKERGLLTHGDLLFFTRELLRDRPEARARVQERYPRLLVDEFQDTDPLQAEVLFYLAGEDPQETNWRACTPRPGSLFIVGDDKQSIYRFRRADKAVFDEVSRLVGGSTHGATVDLTRNFRSLGAICEWCNDAFSELFAEAELENVQADYVPFEAHRPSGEDAYGLRRIDIEKVKYNRGVGIAEKGAARIADFIRAACDGEHPDLSGGAGAVFEGEAASYSDFLILTRTKKRLGQYSDALAERGIPFDVTGSEDLGGSREVRALAGLLRCARRPDDPVAAVAYLRGGVCGFSDADLYAFKQAGGGFDDMTGGVDPGVLDALAGDLASGFKEAFRRIERARERLVSTRPTLAIETIAREAGLIAGALHPAAPEEASLRGGQMLRALTYVRHLAEQGMTWTEISEELQRVISGEEAVDGMTLETGRGEAVRVMNVHQAKGLEAPVVFLADPYSSGGGGRGPDLHVRREESEVAIPVVEGEGHYQRVSHAPLNWHEESDGAFAAEEERHQEAEGRRLLYVAATRAENMLVISTYEPKEGTGYWGALHAALDRADVPVLEASVSTAGRRVPAPAPDLEGRAAERDRRVRSGATPSYRTTTVTQNKAVSEKPRAAAGDLRAEEGYGNAFGTAVHKLFELLVRQRAASLTDFPVAALLRRHLEAPSDEEVARARQMGEELLQSDLWGDVRTAERVHAEYPVAVSTEQAAEEATAGSPLTVQRGTIDLLYQTGEGAWGIVDFKTDRLAGNPFAEGAPKIDEGHPYARQVRVYAEAWAQVASEESTRYGLWFADVGKYVTVDPSR